MTELRILGEYSPALGWLIAGFLIHLLSFCGPAAVSLWIAGRQRPRARVIRLPRRAPERPAAAGAEPRQAA